MENNYEPISKDEVIEAIVAHLDPIYRHFMENRGISQDMNLDYFMDWERFDNGLDSLASAIADALNDAHTYEPLFDGKM